MDLSDFRKKIDETDRKIVALYEERMSLSEQIAGYKIEHGINVLDQQRENEKIESVRAMAGDDISKEGIEEIYRLILSYSKKKQYALMKSRGILSGDGDGGEKNDIG